MARVIVVGGGITGLVAAHELSAIDGIEVILLEASERLGGHIRTSPFAGRPAIDESADAFLARVPHATQLAHSVGLGSELTSPAVANAAVWLDRLHSIPDGIVLGVPGKLTRLATSDLLTWRGKARAGFDIVLPRRDHGDSIGALIRHRFGSEVHDRLVDALVGSIYAADTDRFSVEMVPQLAALAGSRRSLLLAARRARRAAPTPANTPLFYAPSAGMGALVDATAADAAAMGVCIETGSPVTEVAPDGGRWRVDGRQADAVVLAAPAPQARRVVSSVAALPDLLARIETAGVALVTLAVPAASWPDRLRGRSGYLVPKSVQGRVTAVSFALPEVAALGRRRHRDPAGVDRTRRCSVRRSRRRRTRRHGCRRGQQAARARRATVRVARESLAGGIPAVPARSPGVARRGRRAPARPASFSPARAIAASASQPASNRAHGQRSWRHNMWPERDNDPRGAPNDLD